MSDSSLGRTILTSLLLGGVVTVPPALLLSALDFDPSVIILLAVPATLLGLRLLIPHQHGEIQREHGRSASRLADADGNYDLSDEQGGTGTILNPVATHSGVVPALRLFSVALWAVLVGGQFL